MADINTITQELSNASLDLAEAMQEISGHPSLGDHKELNDIITKIVEKLDEVVTKVNELSS